MSDHFLPIRVWDLPTRLFHWVLALCVIASIISANIGGNAMVWHFRLGYVVFTLLAFRLVWGLIGGHWSRFANFIYSPSAVLRYMRGQSRDGEHHDVGHNPVGALSVFCLLGVLAAQVGSGLFADDEIANAGPLVTFVSGSISGKLTWWHKGAGQWLIIALIVLHVCAIVFYLVCHKRNLVRPMIVGDKHLPAGVPTSADHWRVRGIAFLVLTLCGSGVAWLVGLGG